MLINLAESDTEPMDTLAEGATNAAVLDTEDKHGKVQEENKCTGMIHMNTTSNHIQ